MLGFGESGPGNIQNCGVPGAIAAMVTAAAGAWTAAEPAPAPSAAFAGCAGIKAASDVHTVASALAEAGIADQARWQAANDIESVLAAGLGGAPGIALIAGTGSFCLGRDAAGRVAHCGGWGWLIDDIGSGFYLGRQALRAVVQASDGRGGPTALTREVLASFGIREPDELLGRLSAGAANAPVIANLAPVVTSCARAGDEVAHCILRHGANGLAEMVRQVARRLTWTEPPALVVSGSAARSGMPYQPLVEAAIRLGVPGCRILHSDLPPVAGAALRALELAACTLTCERLAQLRAGCARLGIGT